MGSGASAKRQLDKLQERDMRNQVEKDKLETDLSTKCQEKLHELQSEKSDVTERLRKAEGVLKELSDALDKEKHRNIALTFSGLPLKVIGVLSPESGNIQNFVLSKRFDMVSVAQCDIVNFSSLSSRFSPQQVISLMDHFHAMIDEAFGDADIFIMERYVDGCIAASGLTDIRKQDSKSTSAPENFNGRSLTTTPASMVDSSYGSQLNLEDLEDNVDQHKYEQQPQQCIEGKHSPGYFADKLATAALKLMSLTTVEKHHNTLKQQLQVRIALHAGPCSAGVVGLQTTASAVRIPTYKLFGPTLSALKKLTSTGLALQIRVSHQCRELLTEAGQFHFERCPDFPSLSPPKQIESYWLVSKKGLDFPLPPLDLALSLSEYDSITL